MSIFDSNKETMQEFWEGKHKTKDTWWLSGTDPKGEFSLLKIDPPKKKTVLIVGVGFGKCVRYFFNRECEVYALDISQTALDGCKDYIIKGVTNPEDLPTNKFDFAISHLVAQHMTNKDLCEQMLHILRSLHDDSIFAMQFARLPKGASYNESIDAQKLGEVQRTWDDMERIVSSVGGKIVLKIAATEETATYWNGVHIKKLREHNNGRE